MFRKFSNGKLKIKLFIVFFVVIGLLSATCYAGIRVKLHGENIINPNLSYILSETVVEDGRFVSDKIIERRLIGVKEVSQRTPSKVGKILHRWGVRLLDMFVCNVD